MWNIWFQWKPASSCLRRLLWTSINLKYFTHQLLQWLKGSRICLEGFLWVFLGWGVNSNLWIDADHKGEILPEGRSDFKGTTGITSLSSSILAQTPLMERWFCHLAQWQAAHTSLFYERGLFSWYSWNSVFLKTSPWGVECLKIS